jgi:hypothetical protein
VFVVINLPLKNPARIPIKKEEGAEKEHEEDIFAEYIPVEPTEPKPKSNKRRRRRRNPVTGELYYADDAQGGETNAVENNDKTAEQENTHEAGNAGEEDPNDEEANDDENDADDGERDEEEEEIIEDDELDNEFSKDRTLQIMDLNTKNPWISFQGQMYSCEWHTTLGTDMFFAKRPDPTDEAGNSTPAPTEGITPYYPKRVLYTFKEWDLLGMSSAQLVASSVDLEFRESEDEEIDEAEGNPQSLTAASRVVQSGTRRMDTIDEAVDGRHGSPALKNSRTSARSWESKPNMTFLEQFNALRHSKGEKLRRFENGRPFHQAGKELEDDYDVEDTDQDVEMEDVTHGEDVSEVSRTEMSKRSEAGTSIDLRPGGNGQLNEEIDEEPDPSGNPKGRSNAKRRKLDGVSTRGGKSR